MRRYVDDVKSDFNRQIELSELRDLKKNVEDAARSIEGSVGGAVNDMKSSFESVQQSLDVGDGSGTPLSEPEPTTNWDEIYAVRRTRERIKDRRIERERERGFKRPRRQTFR